MKSKKVIAARKAREAATRKSFFIDWSLFDPKKDDLGLWISRSNYHYNLTLSPKTSKEKVLEWAKASDLSPFKNDPIKMGRLKSVDAGWLGWAGTFSATLLDGAPASTDDVLYLVGVLEKLCREQGTAPSMTVDATEEPEAETTPLELAQKARKGIQERLDELAGGVAHLLDLELDRILTTTETVVTPKRRGRPPKNPVPTVGAQSTQIDLDKIFSENRVSAPVATRVIEYFSPLKKEFSRISKDEELAEAYAGYSQTVLDRASEFLENVISKCENLKQTAKISKTRKPRKRKIKPPSEIVKNVKIKKDAVTFGKKTVSSVPPSKILGSRFAILYNAEKRVVTLIESDGPDGLSVKGTTIQGVSEKDSFTLKIRKPELVIPDLTSGGIRAVKGVLNKIKAKKGRATGRLNEETLILSCLD